MSATMAMAALVFGPLLAAVLAFVFPRRGAALGAGAAILVGLAAASLARVVLSEGVVRHAVGGWGAPLGIELRADGLGTLLIAVSAVVGIAVTIYAPAYFRCLPCDDRAAAEHRARYFWPLWLFLWTALDALFLSADLFNLYVTLELLGLSAVMLVALAGKAPALAAAMRYLLVSILGSLCFLMGVALLYGTYGTVDLATLREAMVLEAALPAAALAEAAIRDTALAAATLDGATGPGPAAWTAGGLMLGGLAMKAALFPAHFWLPPAHSSAPAPVSAVLSALVVKAAFCVILRVWFQAFAGLAAPAAAHVLGALGAMAIVWGSVAALRQERLKLLVAYSTVAQIGYLFLLFPLALGDEADPSAWMGALIFVAAHAAAKAAMFLAAGNIERCAGHDRIAELDGTTHALPISSFAFALAGVSLVGIPPTGGFAAKWLFLRAGIAGGGWPWVCVLLAGSLLAAAYVMRFLTRAFTQAERPAACNPVSPAMEWTSFALALTAFLMGLLSAWPGTLSDVGSPFAAGPGPGGGSP